MEGALNAHFSTVQSSLFPHTLLSRLLFILSSPHFPLFVFSFLYLFSFRQHGSWFPLLLPFTPLLAFRRHRRRPNGMRNWMQPASVECAKSWRHPRQVAPHPPVSVEYVIRHLTPSPSLENSSSHLPFACSFICFCFFHRHTLTTSTFHHAVPFHAYHSVLMHCSHKLGWKQA